MNKWPEVLNIMGIEYAIIYVTRRADVDQDEETCNLVGQTDYPRRCITILIRDKGQTKTADDVFQILLHEVLHVILTQCKLLSDSIAKEVHEESVVDTLAYALADMLVRNDMVKFDKPKAI